MNGESVWVAAQHVSVVNDVSKVALLIGGVAPTATPSATPTETSTVTPTPTATPYPFDVGEGPLFFTTNNEFLTVWAKIYAEAGDKDVPLPGYHVRFEFEEFGRPNTKGEQASFDRFEYNVPPGSGSGNRVDYNYKYEYRPPDPKEKDPNTTDTRATLIGTGTWTMYLTDGAGNQLSDPIEFQTEPGNANREVYVAWRLAR
ncbi:MAG: hypothetical protein HC802_22655 [Caldilineaceae bacterium]|nr:hypothetical protein [Caldilineaceae bacterium]